MYDAVDRVLAHTDEIDDALFVDREGRLRTDPSRKPPPGGTPAHLPALLNVPELASEDSPLYAALDAGFVRIRTVRTRGSRPELSFTASVPLSPAQLERVEAILLGEPELVLDGKFAGETVWWVRQLPVEGVSDS